MLNGWNEVAESNSRQANEALRDLERDFPSAGIIVATRTHHSEPAVARRIAAYGCCALDAKQRAEYLEARLGAKAAELRHPHRWGAVARRADTDAVRPVGSCLAVRGRRRNPLHEDSASSPKWQSLQEQRDEHRNSLRSGTDFRSANGLPEGPRYGDDPPRRRGVVRG